MQHSSLENYIVLLLLAATSIACGITLCAIIDGNALLAGGFGGIAIYSGIPTIFTIARMFSRD